MTFIGGTALARTYLDGMRVSEDVDLLTSDVRTVQIAVQEQLPRALRREYPGLAVSRPSPGPRGPTMFAQAADGPVVQLQILEAEPPEIRLEVARTPVSLRYGRLPPTADLIVPTPPSFVAMKVAAYRDRAEPRDLFDFARLAERRHGPQPQSTPRGVSRARLQGR